MVAQVIQPLFLFFLSSFIFYFSFLHRCSSRVVVSCGRARTTMVTCNQTLWPKVCLIHTHTHAYTRTHHLYMHTHAHTIYICIHTHTPFIYAYTRTHHLYMHTHAHTIYTCIHMHTPINVYTRTHYTCRIRFTWSDDVSADVS